MLLASSMNNRDGIETRLFKSKLRMCNLGLWTNSWSEKTTLKICSYQPLTRLSQSSMTSFGVQVMLPITELSNECILSVWSWFCNALRRICGCNLVKQLKINAIKCFSRNGLTASRTMDQNYQETIGQRFQLSFNDVKKMNFAYCNGLQQFAHLLQSFPLQATCPRRISCLRSGYTDPKACQQCRCPDGLTGQVCDRILSTTTNCGQQILRTNGRDQSLSQRGAGNCNFLIMACLQGNKCVFLSHSGTGKCPCHHLLWHNPIPGRKPMPATIFCSGFIPSLCCP